ncbi:DUF2147 domain-containing protein [Acinetobacter sp. MD2(2019)]|uniref:DUF2147 domain-containing protein n=1 Tax=Acinetobacter sp. MD2(2019) TaxID=2605273 RepID=UPI002D1E7D9E|nr:DUF2147 domain-containing protein [Acinetobacter sp. MD2(2019)]MEB3754546.1 DUF2147 domain-containing protein [Acinetobacter sp. MD2(2019)]
MKSKILFSLFVLILGGNSAVYAADIQGVWKNIDDKTGSAKALIQISQTASGVYSGKIVKITPRPDYTPKETCVNCPAPFTNKPILGLEIIQNLQDVGNNSFDYGKVLDPLTGKIYTVKARLSPNGKILFLRGYLGISALGRSQTWIRD